MAAYSRALSSSRIAFTGVAGDPGALRAAHSCSNPRGVQPCESRLRGSAPPASNAATTPTEPLRTARCSGVVPCLSFDPDGEPSS